MTSWNWFKSEEILLALYGLGYGSTSCHISGHFPCPFHISEYDWTLKAEWLCLAAASPVADHLTSAWPFLRFRAVQVYPARVFPTHSNEDDWFMRSYLKVPSWWRIWSRTCMIPSVCSQLLLWQVTSKVDSLVVSTVRDHCNQQHFQLTPHFFLVCSFLLSSCCLWK